MGESSATELTEFTKVPLLPRAKLQRIIFGQFVKSVAAFFALI